MIMMSLLLFSICNNYKKLQQQKKLHSLIPVQVTHTRFHPTQPTQVKLSPSPSILKCWPIRSPPLKFAICWARPSLSPSGQMKLPSGAFSVSHARLPLHPPLLWTWQISVHSLSHYRVMWWWTENCWWKVVLGCTL